ARAAVLTLSEASTRRRARYEVATRLGLLILALGALFPTNAWDVPVYAALTAVSLFMATAYYRTIGVRLALAALCSAITGISSYLLYLPFHTHYVALFGSVERVRSPSPLWAFADHLGGLLTIAGIGIIICLLGLRRDAGSFADLSPTPLLVLVALLIAAML